MVQASVTRMRRSSIQRTLTVLRQTRVVVVMRTVPMSAQPQVSVPWHSMRCLVRQVRSRCITQTMQDPHAVRRWRRAVAVVIRDRLDLRVEPLRLRSGIPMMLLVRQSRRRPLIWIGSVRALLPRRPTSSRSTIPMILPDRPRRRFTAIALTRAQAISPITVSSTRILPRTCARTPTRSRLPRDADRSPALDRSRHSRARFTRQPSVLRRTTSIVAPTPSIVSRASHLAREILVWSSTVYPCTWTYRRSASHRTLSRRWTPTRCNRACSAMPRRMRCVLRLCVKWAWHEKKESKGCV